MTARRFPLLMLLFAFGSWSCPRGREVAPAPDSMRVIRCAEAVTVDGRLDEACWQRAAFVGPLARHDGKAPGRQATRAAAVWDDGRIVFGFQCQDEDIQTPYSRRDEELYRSEVVEIFLDPDSDRKDYLEFEVSPAGTRFDASFTARRRGMDLSYNPPSEVAVRVDGTLNQPGDQDRSWTVELAIPFAAMRGRGRFPPRAGDCWRANLFRLDKSKRGGEAQAWRPTTGDFHDLNAFGVLCFEGL